jgi:hypothetical protein
MQFAGVRPFSPAGSALGLGANAALPGETEEQKKKRLAAIAASTRNIAGALGGTLSPAGANLFGGMTL